MGKELKMLLDTSDKVITMYKKSRRNPISPVTKIELTSLISFYIDCTNLCVNNRLHSSVARAPV